MSDIKDMMFEDSKDLLDEIESNDISEQCVQLKKIEDAILEKEKELKALKDKADIISSSVIPELMLEQGLSQLKLADGSAVTVAKTYNCTVNKQQIESAYKWLRDNELGDLIKNEVAVSFGVGEDNKAQRLLDLAAENGYQPSTKTKVEPMVLKALYRERIESGLDMPSDLFNLFIKDKTKITRK
jgi:hypothetical protein